MRETANPIRNFIRPYYDNACNIREQRKELRGTKSLGLLMGYLVFMALVLLSAYSAIISQNEGSLSQVQGNLVVLYSTLMSILAGFVCISCIVNTATNLVQEKNSRSLEMVLTTPVDVRAYLIGRLLASFRTNLLILSLSLPFISITVLLGGYTWQEVASTYLCLAFHALILGSMGLSIGASQAKEGGAALYSLVAVLVYQIATAFGLIQFFAGGGSGANSTWGAALNSFSAPYVAALSSKIFGFDIPNVVIVGVISLLLSRFFLMSACSTLAPIGTRFTLHFRIQALAALLILGIYNAGSALVATTAMIFGAPGAITPKGTFPNFTAATITTMCLGLLMISVSSHDKYGTLRTKLDGLWSLKGFLTGTPAGALPLIILAFACSYLPQIIIVKSVEGAGAFVLYGLYGLSFMIFVYACTMLFSLKSGYGYMARIFTYLLCVGLFVLPALLASILLSMIWLNVKVPSWDSMQLWRAIRPGYWPIDLILSIIVLGILSFLALSRVNNEYKRLNGPPARP